MKWAVFWLLISFASLAYAQDSQEKNSNPGINASSDVSISERLSKEERDELILFLIKEVLPSFGGLKELKPSFKIHFNSEGPFIQSCSIQWKIEQFQTIHYNIADVELYDFQAAADIGRPLFLVFDVSCSPLDTAQKTKENQKHTTKFTVSITFEDQFQETQFYTLKVRSFDQDQLDIKLWSLQFEVQISSLEKEMRLGSDGRIRPVSNWPADPDQIFETIQVVSQFSLNGSARLSTPAAVLGERQDVSFTAVISGDIFMSRDGDVYPMVDISME